MWLKISSGLLTKPLCFHVNMFIPVLQNLHIYFFPDPGKFIYNMCYQLSKLILKIFLLIFRLLFSSSWLYFSGNLLALITIN